MPKQNNAWDRLEKTLLEAREEQRGSKSLVDLALLLPLLMIPAAFVGAILGVILNA